MVETLQQAPQSYWSMQNTYRGPERNVHYYKEYFGNKDIIEPVSFIVKKKKVKGLKIWLFITRIFAQKSNESKKPVETITKSDATRLEKGKTVPTHERGSTVKSLCSYHTAIYLLNAPNYVLCGVIPWHGRDNNNYCLLSYLSIRHWNFGPI